MSSPVERISTAAPEAANPGNEACVRSMTGYALVNRTTTAGELTVSLRSVNHRGLDLHFHQFAEFGVFENGVRTLLKRCIARGHVEVRVNLARRSEHNIENVNRTVLRGYVITFREIAAELEIDGLPDLNTLLSLPGVFSGATTAARSLDESFGNELLSAMDACAAELNAFREREGAGLRSGMQRDLESIDAAVGGIEAARAETLEDLRNRLRERLSELLAQTGVPESRVLEEAAVLADRSDVQEELVRLNVHVGELRRILLTGGEVGKRLDFLLQEMNRETNTILSKTSGAGDTALQITNLGLSIKANIERIREQALNLE